MMIVVAEKQFAFKCHIGSEKQIQTYCAEGLLIAVRDKGLIPHIPAIAFFFSVAVVKQRIVSRICLYVEIKADIQTHFPVGEYDITL